MDCKPANLYAPAGCSSAQQHSKNNAIGGGGGGGGGGGNAGTVGPPPPGNATLSGTPRTLTQLWDEYMDRIGG